MVTSGTAVFSFFFFLNLALQLFSCQKAEKAFQAKNLLQNSKLGHADFEAVLELDKLAHVVFVLHRVKQRRVHEGWTQDVDPDAVASLSGRVLQGDETKGSR